MTLGLHGESSFDPWIAPGTALCFSIVLGVLAPHYRTWFGDPLPPFTTWFLKAYPIWIALSVVGLVVQALLKTLTPNGAARKVWTTFDAALAIVSVVMVAAGLIALAIPVIRGPQV